MGTWGAGIFENDAVLDWLCDLVETDSLQEACRLLNHVANLETDEYLVADTASAALGAAEIVAALHDGRLDDLPEDAQEWVEGHRLPVDFALRRLASRAVERVLIRSELRDLWSEGGPTDPEWMEAVSGLLARLRT